MLTLALEPSGSSLKDPVNVPRLSRLPYSCHATVGLTKTCRSKNLGYRQLENYG